MLMFALSACLLGSLDVQDGTILVLENSNRVVKVYTRSEVTHVAMILNVGGKPTVYEANPSEVRRLPLSEYYAEVGRINRRRDEDERIRLRLYQPMQPYTAAELQQLGTFFESQVGRRYSIRGYVRRKPGDGIHCAELVSTALVRTGRYQFPPNYSVSPAALVAQITPTHQTPVEVPVPIPNLEGSWCERSWKWWGGAFSWCGWACQETWLFCW